MARIAMELTKQLAAVVVFALLSFSHASPETKPDTSESTHHLGAMIGGGIGSYREDLVVPISFDGPVFSLGGRYTVRTPNSSYNIRLLASLALLENRFSHEAYVAALELRPAWTKMVWGNGNGRQIRCGIALPLQMRNLFMDTWDDAHLYWLTTHSLAVVGEYHTVLPRLGYSVIRLDLPLIGFVSRPPEYRYQQQEPLTHFSYHFSAPNGSFDFKTLWGYQSPMLQVMISRGSRGALLNLGLELTMGHCSVPEDIWVLNTRLLFSYQWRIG